MWAGVGKEGEGVCAVALCVLCVLGAQNVQRVGQARKCCAPWCSRRGVAAGALVTVMSRSTGM